MRARLPARHSGKLQTAHSAQSPLGRKILAQGAQPWVQVANQPAPERGERCPRARLLTPRSGANASCARFPVLTHWAMLLRPDLGRERIVAACQESKAQ